MTNVVAIDGPSGAGKSTVSHAVADQLGFSALDTGALYRAVTLAVLRAGIDVNNAVECERIASESLIRVNDRTMLNDRDVSSEIRSQEVTTNVSAVSAHPKVRENVNERIRLWVQDHGGGVVEGRDIGSVVLPDAFLKIYLTASESERARRRHREFTGDMGVSTVKKDIQRRDQLDSTRKTAPLRAADDALVIDSTDRSVEDIASEIVGLYRNKTT